MSQLNNTNENLNNENLDINKKKKMKSSTKIIIFLVIFLIVSVATTIGAIYYTNSKTIINVQTNPIEIADDGLGIKTLTQQYDENDLKIIDVYDKKGSRTPKYDWDTNTGKINFNYINIDGLKNASIENQINNEIKALSYSLYTDSELKDSKIDYIDISAYCNANFGNTLSVGISKTIYYINDSIGTRTDYGLNYNLVDGSKIPFVNLFTNSSLKNILVQSIYDNVLDKYIYDSEFDLSLDMSKLDLSTVEDETYILLNKLITNLDNIKFSYTPSFIYVYDYDLTITMSDIYSSIAIYNRFKTSENIFDGTYIGNKNMFVFSERYQREDIQYSKYEDIYDNLRVEVSIEMNNEILANSVAKENLNATIKKVENEISKMQKEAKNNTQKAFVYTAYISMYDFENYDLANLNIENNILNIWGETKIYKMSKEYYNNVFIEKIAAFHSTTEKAEYWPVFAFYEEDNANVTTEIISEVNENIDLYTNKTPDQLIGEYYINQQKLNLEEIQTNLNNGIDCGDLESQLTYIYDSIISIKEEYKLTDKDIKEVLDLITEIRNASKKQEQETLNNTNIIKNTNSIIINEL